MTIVVNTVIATTDWQNKNAEFIEEVFLRIIEQEKHHTFVIISEKKENIFSTFRNVVIVVSFPKKRNLIQWYWWFNFKIPSLLKKHKADLFFSCSAISFASLKTRQLLFINNLSFACEPSSISKKDISFQKKFFQKSLCKADRVFTVSEFCKQGILKLNKSNREKIEVVYKGISSQTVIPDYDKKEKIKSTISNGYEYFAYTGIIDESRNLVNLLKSFSLFKRRQKSNMQLIIAGTPGLQYENFMKQLSLFKFKSDVKVLTDLTRQQEEEIIAGAYVFINIPMNEYFPGECLLAMQLLVPVVASSNDAIREICADAVLYADPESLHDVSAQMMHLFRDEKLRKKLIDKGRGHVKKFDWETAAKVVWQSMTENFSKKAI